MTNKLNVQSAQAVQNALKGQKGAANSLLQPFRVIIVEDMEALAELMSETLRSIDCQVKVAHRRSEAIPILSASDQVPDLVLLDIDLPDGNGFDICAWLRQQPTLSRVPVVFCTGRDPVKTSAKAAELNAGTLFKPFTMEALLTVIETTRQTSSCENLPS
jgi:DNA-binding response OmpR family regulator